MPKLEGPLFSLEAQKSMKKTLAFQNRPSGSAVTKYSKPGSVNQFIPSLAQRNQRSLVALIITRWQTMTAEQKAAYQVLADDSGSGLPAYQYFLREAQKNTLAHLGLIAFWSFNEDDGATTEDISGNGHTATLQPNYPTDAPLRQSSVNPKFGNSIFLDNTDDYLSVSGTDITGPTALSIELWRKGTTIILGAIVGMNAASTAALYVPRDGTEIMLFFGNNNFRKWNNPVPNAVDGKWHHICATIPDRLQASISSSTLHIDGILQTATSTDATGPHPARNLFRIGLNSPYYGKGNFDDLRIWNRVLGTDEIVKHFRMLRK